MMKETADIKRVEAMADAFADERLRWLIGKGDVLVQNGELTHEKFGNLIKKTIHEEYTRNYIMKQLTDGPKTVQEIASATNLESHHVLWNLLAMMKWNKVEIAGEHKHEYIYAIKEF
jgi:predicted Rossmann fold nucleotide-binding protein DprA/Smf involved in DNA uptake